MTVPVVAAAVLVEAVVPVWMAPTVPEATFKASAEREVPVPLVVALAATARTTRPARQTEPFPEAVPAVPRRPLSAQPVEPALAARSG